MPQFTGKLATEQYNPTTVNDKNAPQQVIVEKQEVEIEKPVFKADGGHFIDINQKEDVSHLYLQLFSYT